MAGVCVRRSQRWAGLRGRVGANLHRRCRAGENGIQASRLRGGSVDRVDVALIPGGLPEDRQTGEDQRVDE